ncbi:Adenosine receptor A1 [Desmophyllum pertusum]|uniref:Adenosine receptor A1 n=1 Tax=Desmophyllum pertusum TaxID=174260 RepID=A0A9X0CTE1_9CNID|nr:Adenosine receptor A1 [Desmophyllum pertusum]
MTSAFSTGNCTMNNSSGPTAIYLENKTDDGLPRTPIVIILSFLSFGTVLGNSLVFTAILINPALHTVTYLSVFSLAIADFLAGMVAMPSYILKKFSFGEPIDVIICDVFRFSYFLTGYASILSLSVISVERLLAVKSPLRYTTVVTHGRVITGLILTWLDAIIISSLPFVPWEPTSPYKECNYEPTRWWSIMVIITNVILPFLLIVTCYTYLYLTARSHLRKILSDRNSVGNGTARRPRRTNERRASTTILIVIGVFIASWFPSCFYYFLLKTCPQCFSESFRSKKSIFNALVKILTFTSSFANPIIYCWRSKHFRNAFRKILTKMSGRFARAQRNDSTAEIRRRRVSTISSTGRNEACNAFSSNMDVGKYIVILENTQKHDLRTENRVEDAQL